MILSADPPPRVAFSTLAFPDATLARAVSLGRRWGYAGVELRLIDGELIDPSMPAAERARVKRALAGLPVVAVDSSIRLTDLLRPHLVYLQVKDALAATGEVVSAGQGDGELRETLAALRDSGFAGFMSLEPHLAQTGRFGGFSGPEGFHRPAEALKFLLNEASRSCPSGDAAGAASHVPHAGCVAHRPRLELPVDRPVSARRRADVVPVWRLVSPVQRGPRGRGPNVVKPRFHHALLW